jgi:hypothetical protein
MLVLGRARRPRCRLDHWPDPVSALRPCDGPHPRRARACSRVRSLVCVGVCAHVGGRTCAFVCVSARTSHCGQAVGGPGDRATARVDRSANSSSALRCLTGAARARARRYVIGVPAFTLGTVVWAHRNVTLSH